MIKYWLTDNNLHLIDSYKVTEKSSMIEQLNRIHGWFPSSKLFSNRTISSMVKEWRVHNLLYKLGIQRDRTKDVDLNYPQKWYVKICYSIISFIYFW